MNGHVNTVLQSAIQSESQIIFGMRFDAIDKYETLAFLKARSSSTQFGYIVTPNVQHVVDMHREVTPIAIYEDALLCLCDSQPVRALAKFLHDVPPLVTGADLTVSLFENVIRDGDTITSICASEELATLLREKYPNLHWHIHIPPANTEVGTPAFDACVKFLIETPARFSFVCIGAPKSEEICHAAYQIKGTTGTAICSGAALEFLVGLKRRAPRIFQTFGIEWTYRLMSEPGRLWHRYASAGPTLLKLFANDLMVKWLPSKNSR
ncbi:MAG: WecB/TagA/CpsF family glycosyltransferase [Hyphomicrobiales bacterium]